MILHNLINRFKLSSITLDIVTMLDTVPDVLNDDQHILQDAAVLQLLRGGIDKYPTITSDRLIPRVVAASDGLLNAEYKSIDKVDELMDKYGDGLEDIASKAWQKQSFKEIRILGESFHSTPPRLLNQFGTQQRASKNR